MTDKASFDRTSITMRFEGDLVQKIVAAAKFFDIQPEEYLAKIICDCVFVHEHVSELARTQKSTMEPEH